MLHAICSVISVFLIILGVVEIARMVVLMILRTKGDENMMIIVPIKGHDEEAEYLLRSAAAKIKWFNSVRRQKIICLDCGMDEETKRICMLIAKDYKFMEIYNVSEFQQLLLEIR